MSLAKLLTRFTGVTWSCDDVVTWIVCVYDHNTGFSGRRGWRNRSGGGGRRCCRTSCGTCCRGCSLRSVGNGRHFVIWVNQTWHKCLIIFGKASSNFPIILVFFRRLSFIRVREHVWWVCFVCTGRFFCWLFFRVGGYIGGGVTCIWHRTLQASPGLVEFTAQLLTVRWASNGCF